MKTSFHPKHIWQWVSLSLSLSKSPADLYLCTKTFSESVRLTAPGKGTSMPKTPATEPGGEGCLKKRNSQDIFSEEA